MAQVSLILVLISALFYGTTGKGSLPSFIKPCSLKHDFDNCIMDQMKEIISPFVKGIPGLGVPEMDPMHLDEDIVIKGNGLDFALSNGVIHGLSSCEVKSFKFDLSADVLELEFFAHKIKLTGNYSTDGKIIILPLKGHGAATINAHNLSIKIKCKISHSKTADGEFLKLDSPHYTYTFGSAEFDLKNLFNGNKELSDITHKFINENWQQIMDDLAPPAMKQMITTGIKAVNIFFHNIDLKQMVRD